MNNNFNEDKYMSNNSSLEKAAKILEQVEEIKNNHFVDFVTISTEVHEKLKISEFKILEETLTNTEFHHKYITILFKLKRVVNSLYQIERALYRVLYTYYSEEYPRALRTKEIREAHIHSDAHYLKFETILQEFKLMVDYLDRVDQLFKERSYSISAASRIMEN